MGGGKAQVAEAKENTRACRTGPSLCFPISPRELSAAHRRAFPRDSLALGRLSVDCKPSRL